MDREEISGISREFDEVFKQVAAAGQPSGPVPEPGPEEKKEIPPKVSSGRVRAWKQPSEEQEEFLYEGEVPRFGEEAREDDLEMSHVSSEIPRAGEEMSHAGVQRLRAGEEMSHAGVQRPRAEEEMSHAGARIPRAGGETPGGREHIPAAEDEQDAEETMSETDSDRRRGSFGLLRPSDGLLAAFFVPIIIMVVIFAQRGIFPFGQESFLRTDMYHQYAPFFSEFQHKLRTGGSLLYSWDIGMGVNFAALYAYYLASPINWLIVLCPKEYIIEFMSYMIVFKIGLSGLSFAWYLGKHNHSARFGAGFFGIFYALSGYMAAYSWNIMWLDCILLFPLIMLGIERLVKEKKGMLYCITLGLSILSNYYISIMICLFMVLYFICLQILEGKRSGKDWAVSTFQFAVYSLLAGGLAAVVLLPEVAVLHSTASADSTFPKTFEMYFSIIDMLARHIPNVQTEIGLDHWPNIYCGVAVYLFFLLYLACRRISVKEKAVYCGLLLLFFASFSFNVLNFIWHGFHYPNSLPCRQSFIYIFLLLSMCYRAYLYLDVTPKKHVAAAFWGSVCYVLLAQKLLMKDEAYHFIVFYVAIVFLAVYAGLIYFAKNPRHSKATAALLALAVVAVEAAVNTTATSVTTTSRTAYKADNDEVLELTKDLKSDSGFYRVDKVGARTKNDGAWMNFPSASLFSSVANADMTDFFKKMGCEGSTNAYSIVGSTPVVDSLFSLQYAIYREKQENPRLSLHSYSGEYYLYENPYTLPLGFMMPDIMETGWQTELPNPVDIQNDLSEILDVPYSFELLNGKNDGASFSFTAEQDGEYYICVMNHQVKAVRLTAGESTDTIDNVNRGFLIETGFLKAGETVTLENKEGSDDLNARAYLFCEEGLGGIYEKLNASPFTVTQWEDSRLEGVIDAGEGGTMFLSIPFDKGWTVELDGSPITPRKVLGAFTGLELPGGRHTVTFRYYPPGLKEGLMVSGASIALVLVIAAAGFLLGKRKKKPTPYDRLDEEWSGGESWNARKNYK